MRLAVVEIDVLDDAQVAAGACEAERIAAHAEVQAAVLGAGRFADWHKAVTS